MQAAGLIRATPPAPVLVAYSGGMDSAVLLHALAATPGYREAGLRAVHVHHGLHADADAWAQHCQQQCAALGLPCRSCACKWHATAAAGWKRPHAPRGMQPLQRPWQRVSGWHWHITVMTRPKPSCCARCALPALTDWRRCVRSASSARARCGARCSATHVPTWRPMRRRMQCAGSTTPAIPIRSTTAISCARRSCRRCSSAGRWRPMHWPAARSCVAMPAPCCTTTTSTCCPPSATAPAPWSCSRCAAIPRAPRTPVARLGGRRASAAVAGAGRART